MISHLKENFLYIDCDTVIVDSLAEIDDCKYELAAVYNSGLGIEYQSL